MSAYLAANSKRIVNPIRQLASQTAIYGLSSIVGRFLNYLLVPLYTRVFLQAEFGIYTQLYAYIAFAFVLFTYGMETAYFRFYEQEKSPKVASTALGSLLITTLVLTAILVLTSGSIAHTLQLVGHQDLIIFTALILGADALGAIPFAQLRSQNKPVKFAAIKLVNIGINIGINLFFLVLCPEILKSSSLASLHPLITSIYNPSFGIGYIFIANLAASGITLLLLYKELLYVRFGFDPALWKRMIRYASPLILVGLAGIVNEMLDRVLLKFLLHGTPEQNDAQIGIYGAAYKLSMLMSIFIQAYRYAAEPFFFAQASKTDARDIYAKTLKFFVIVGAIVFLGTLLYLDIIKYFLGRNFYEGLHVVPILLMANLFLGIYYNLSIWYKLTDKTLLGAYVTVGGALVTIGLNIWLIPIMGYTGSAWATLACYAFMAFASYFFGMKYYPVHYPLGRIALYIVSACAFICCSGFGRVGYLSPSVGQTHSKHGLICKLFGHDLPPGATISRAGSTYLIPYLCRHAGKSCQYLPPSSARLRNHRFCGYGFASIAG